MNGRTAAGVTLRPGDVMFAVSIAATSDEIAAITALVPDFSALDEYVTKDGTGRAVAHYYVWRRA